jgi:hypothetical protein
MACSGPSQDFAYQQAEKAISEISDLFRRYEIMTKFNYDVGFDHLREEQAENFEKLEKLVKDIFWTDACLSF